MIAVLDSWNKLRNMSIISQGSPKRFCQRVTSYYTTVQGADILRNVIVSGMLHST